MLSFISQKKPFGELQLRSLTEDRSFHHAAKKPGFLCKVQIDPCDIAALLGQDFHQLAARKFDQCLTDRRAGKVESRRDFVFTYNTTGWELQRNDIGT